MAYSKPFTKDYPVTSGFGQRWGKSHDGIDFGCPKGTPILAIESGKITVSQLDQYGGNWVDLQLDNGLVVRYLHFSQRLVQVGDRVNKAQLIGYSGGVPGEFGSGMSTGAHLHLGIKRNGQFFNWYPEIWPQMQNPNSNTTSNQTSASNMNKVLEQTWQKLQQISGQGHTEYIKTIVGLGDLNLVVNDYADRYAEKNSAQQDVINWEKYALTRVLDKNLGAGWKDQVLTGNLLDLNQAIARNDLGFIIQHNISLRDQIQKSPATSDYLNLRKQNSDLQNQLASSKNTIDGLKSELQASPNIRTLVELQNKIAQQQLLIDQLTKKPTLTQSEASTPFTQVSSVQTLQPNVTVQTNSTPNSTDKVFFQSKKWLSGFVNTLASAGILLFQSAQIDTGDSWQNIMAKLGPAVATILGINFVSSSYISGQSKVDQATATYLSRLK